jgi:hypothetical protein
MKILYVIYIVWVVFITMNTGVVTCHAENNPANDDASVRSQHSTDALEKLFRSDRLRIITITYECNGLEKTVDRVGAFMMVEEKDYWVVAGNEAQIEKISKLNCRTREPVESDYKYRDITVYIKNIEEIKDVQAHCSDLFPTEKIPGKIQCRCLDFQLHHLEALGFEIGSPLEK